MVRILRADQVSDEATYAAFRGGFADYEVKMEMSQEFFLSHFFKTEGNERDLSYVAFDGETPVGVVLGGLKTDEPIRTLRCGAMAILPEHRGTGLADALFERHIESAREAGCRQMFLEVLSSNARAIRFYERMGYEKTHDLYYWGYEPDAMGDSPWKEKMQPCTLETVRRMRRSEHSHMPWQGSFDYFSPLDVSCYGIRVDSKWAAVAVATPRKLFYLYVMPEFRLQGMGRALVEAVYEAVESKGMAMAHSNHTDLAAFAHRLGMERLAVRQFEMMRWLD